LHQCEERRRIFGIETDAAMGSGPPKFIDILRAVDGMTKTGEKNQMTHRGIMPHIGKMQLLHSKWRIFTTRRGVTGNPSRYRPDIFLMPTNQDGHFLAMLIDGNYDLRGMRLSSTQENQSRS